MKPIKERFFAKVTIRSDKGGDECWEWTGAKSGSGYGQFWDGKRAAPAHWFLLDTRPAKGKEACHHCDNKLCVRPSHIFIGTRADNMKDMVSKNRHNTAPGCRAMLKVRRPQNGEGNHEAKLTDGDVAMVRSIGRGYGRGVKLAKLLKVSATVISGIWSGSRWPHIKPDATAAQRAEALLRPLNLWKDTP